MTRLNMKQLKNISSDGALFRLLLSGLLLLAFLPWQPAAAQDEPEHEKRRERIESARVAFLTDKMKLTTEQSQKFWPVYNEFDGKRRELKKQVKTFRGQNLESLSEAEARESISRMMDVRQKELDLEKTYVDKFLKVVSAKQLATMYRSEREFMRLLLQRLDEKSESAPKRVTK